METTTQGIDARAYLIGWLKGVTGMFNADIQGIPEDKWTATFGGCTRPANELAADAMAFMVWTTEAMKGNLITGDYGDMIKELAGKIATKDTAIAKMGEVADNMASAIAGASDETMNKVVTAPFGMDAPLFAFAQIAVSHIWYHDGQFNYIHCLLGDDKIYWQA